MKWSSFRYLVHQGWHSMVANRLMTLASMGVLTACLFITGVAVLLSLNVNRFVDYLGTQNEIECFISDTYPDSQISELQSRLAAFTPLEKPVDGYLKRYRAQVDSASNGAVLKK